MDASSATLALPEATRTAPPCCKPNVRKASPLEVYNIPLFEVPPMLDVRAEADFCRSHVVCAVSVPAEDGLDAQCLFQRILAHDDVWGWCLQHPFVIVHDEATSERAEWLVNVLTQVVEERSGSCNGFAGADRAEQLLRRLSKQCKHILLMSHQEFAHTFGFCCMAGEAFETVTSFNDEFGPLPRCALVRPRTFLAGRQVKLSTQLLRTLGITHMIVNGDSWDVMDGTSGGNSHWPRDRSTDIPGICYLKCDIPDHADDPDLLQVLEGCCLFLEQCASKGGTAMVCVHGTSRSAGIVCAFIMKSLRVSVDVAWCIFEEAHIQTDVQLVWWDALQRLEQQPRKRGIEDERLEAQGQKGQRSLQNASADAP